MTAGGVLVELCSGSAALALSLLGAGPIMTYQGGKGRYTDAIAGACGLSRPGRVVLVDVSPWPEALELLASPGTRSQVVGVLEGVLGRDPLEVWAAWAAAPAPADPCERAAVFLGLQRLSYRGKAIRLDGDSWATVGVSATDALGRPPSPSFGGIRPQLPALARRCAAFPDLPICGVRADAREVAAGDQVIEEGATVYIDPPYRGTTGYTAADLGRDEVLAIAADLERRGCRVILSEAEPLPLQGWCSVEITGQRAGRRSEWQTPEWLTASPGVLADQVEPQLALWGAQ